MRRGVLPILVLVLLIGISALPLPLAALSAAAAPADQATTVATPGADVVVPATLPSLTHALRRASQPTVFIAAAVASWSLMAAGHAVEWRGVPGPLPPRPGHRRALLQVYLN
jgi:hypothetical protein